MSKYTKKLRDSFKDEHDVALEMLLSWIAVMLTATVVLMLLGMCSG